MNKIEKLISELCPLPAGRQGMVWKNNPDDMPDFQEGVWYVYVLICENKSLYKGFTKSIKQRYIQHLNGIGARHTKQHKPVCLLYYETYYSEKDAVEREKYLKSGIGREFLKKIQKEYENR